MSLYDDETERYLAEFRPRAVQPLEPMPKGRDAPLLWVAAVVAVVLLAVGLLWFAHREAGRLREAANIQPRKVSATRAWRYESTLALTRLALEDGERLESLLAGESRKELPPCRGEQSTLSVLAKE